MILENNQVSAWSRPKTRTPSFVFRHISNEVDDGQEVTPLERSLYMTSPPPQAAPPQQPEKALVGDTEPTEAEKEANEIEEKAECKPHLRIALLSWESLHSVAVGGVAAHVTELAAALQRRGHNVHVFVRTGSGQSEYENIFGVHYHRCGMTLDPDFTKECENMCESLVRAMHAAEEFQGYSFDVVHGHDWLVAKGIMMSKGNNRKIVATMHSTEYGRCGNRTYDSGPSQRIRWMENEACHQADRVICVSGALCDEIKNQYHPGGDKVRCVYNGIACPRYDGFIDAGPVKQEYGIGPMDPVVLYVGRITAQKGTDLLVEAIPRILGARGDAKFVFVGDGDMRGGLEARMRQMGVGHACRWLGAMKNDDPRLINLFKACDVVCMPSRNEPFGIVMLETWAAGKPLVATRQGGPAEVVSHDVDGFLVDISVDGIVWGICQIFSNFAHAQWMGTRGRVKAAFSYSWDNIAIETEKIYYELIEPYLRDIDIELWEKQQQELRIKKEAARIAAEEAARIKAEEDRIEQELLRTKEVAAARHKMEDDLLAAKLARAEEQLVQTRIRPKQLANGTVKAADATKKHVLDNSA